MAAEGVGGVGDKRAPDIKWDGSSFQKKGLVAGSPFKSLRSALSKVRELRSKEDYGDSVYLVSNRGESQWLVFEYSYCNVEHTDALDVSDAKHRDYFVDHEGKVSAVSKLHGDKKRLVGVDRDLFAGHGDKSGFDLDKIHPGQTGATLDDAFLRGVQASPQTSPTPEKVAERVLQIIKTEAKRRAEDRGPTVDPSSAFHRVLIDRYLSEYLSHPNRETGKQAVDKISEQIPGRGFTVTSIFDDRWVRGARRFWNSQKLPEIPEGLRDLPMFQHIKNLPREIGAATAILSEENRVELLYPDVPFLLGEPNEDTSDDMADVLGGGKNISQLMHWATGAKYADLSPDALREFFLIYELWHLEGWDVFGIDAINDLIAEEQGRLLGVELLKGENGRIKSKEDLQPFLDVSFGEARVWVGRLLGFRRKELDEWIVAKERKWATIHWRGDKARDLWHSPTVHQMASAGMPIQEILRSPLVRGQIELYTLLYEGESLPASEISDLQKWLALGKLDPLFRATRGGIPSKKDIVEARKLLQQLQDAQ